jgi:hypothetical protein
VLLAADYPFLDVLWTMFIFFLWVIWFWILITVFADLFRRHDTSGLVKVAWIVFVIIVPFLGVFIYLIVNGQGMAERNVKAVEAAGARAGGGPATEIATAKELLDSGAINQEEFEAIKRKATAG